MIQRDRQRRQAHKARKVAEAARVPQGMTWREKKEIARQERERSLASFRAASPFNGLALAGLLGGGAMMPPGGRR